jgi:hypothetical protein
MCTVDQFKIHAVKIQRKLSLGIVTMARLAVQQFALKYAPEHQVQRVA